MRIPCLPVALAAFAAICFFPITTAPMHVIRVSPATTNSPPVAVDNHYDVHRLLIVQGNGVLDNDYDPDGDVIHLGPCTEAAHGRVACDSATNGLTYEPNIGYTGADSFTYQSCDELACSTGTVTLNVRNAPPTPKDDAYFVRNAHLFVAGLGIFGNDTDPEGDGLGFMGCGQASHGFAFCDVGSAGFVYNATPGYVGFDSFTYQVCDSLGLCTDATVYLFVDDENTGSPGCNTGVGEPVNVTNGNVYLQQSDYHLPSVGAAIDVTRSFNSQSQVVGLFGRGWSTGYDESLRAYNDIFIRLSLPDGRPIYFTRPDSNASFASASPSFHGQLAQNSDGTFALSLKDGSVHRFSAVGKLLSLADRNGNTTTLNYGVNGFLSSVTDPFGRVLTLTTNGNGQVLSLSDAMGAIANYTYNGDQLLSVTYADNSAFQFTYDGNNHLLTVTDALGHTVESHTYDAQGRALTSATDGGIEQYTLNYLNNNETDVTDALGRVSKYMFEKGSGRNVVTSVEGLCSCGGSQLQSWTYDSQLNVASKTDALGHVTSYTYDGDDNIVTSTDATGTVTITYNQFSQALTVTDQLGGVTTNAYDAQGNLHSGTNALGNPTYFASDSRGQLLTITDARSKLTSFAYDASGNLITKTDALGHATQFSFDARSRLTSVTNALGHTTAFTYDGVGRPTQITQADGSVISYEYDRGGRRIAMTDAKGIRTTYAYDGANRLTSETDALNQSTSYGYDLVSNLISHTDALGRVTNYEYDDFNRLKKVIYPPATAGSMRLFEAVAYDAAGNVVNRTDTAGRVTTLTYDGVNRVVTTTDAANKVTSFEYDALGRTTAMVDALSQRYRFRYDAVGQLKRVRRGAGVMSFQYDPVGNRKRRTDYNGTLTTYDYDALNRLKTIDYPDATTVDYTYDKLSRLQTATNESGTLNLDYNKMNRVTSVTDVFGQVVDYNYDLNGNRTKLSLNAAVVATYRYDAIDRLTKILDAASATFNFAYDPTSKLTSLKAPNGVNANYQYDGLDRLTRLTNKKGQATIADFQYQFNNASNISQVSDLASTNNYSYDFVDRLAAATHSNQPNESYVYDGVGNRTSSNLSASYGYQPFNRLVSTASASYTYDANFNLISKTEASGTTQYVWDFENRLKQVTLPNGKIVSYKYDALGRRVERSATVAPPLPVTTTERYIYDGADVIRDTDGNGVTLADYLNGPGIDNKLRQTTATGSLYFVQDHLGSTRALTDAIGNVVEQQQYDSFGNSAGSTRTRYGYTGRERDPDTGLYYYRARFYDPHLGRFISEDPIRLAGGINQFSYVSNNPQNSIDPTGLYESDVHYYLTYYLAKKMGCFSESEAREIAAGDQGVDDNPLTAPAYGSTQNQRDINAYYHALHPGSHLPYLTAHWNNASFGRRGNPSGLGIYLHYLQDMYSHEGFTDARWGHSPRYGGTHNTDKTSSDVSKAMKMARATWDALSDFALQTGRCRCVDEPDPEMWKTVEEFARASGGGFYDSRRHSIEEIDQGYLNKKIRILSLP